MKPSFGLLFLSTLVAAFTSNDSRPEPATLTGCSFTPIVSQCGESETQKTEKSLDDYVKRLQSFLKGREFDFLSFEASAAEFKSQISDLDHLVETQLNYFRFAPQLAFARDMFQKMADAAEKLKRYKENTLPGHTLVFRMVDLNVRIFSVQHHSGGLDLDLEDYAEKLRVLYHDLYFWGRKLKKVPAMPSGMYSLFVVQSYQAKSRLEKLRSQIPLNERVLDDMLRF